MSTDLDKIFNDFLINILTKDNAPLVCELRYRWKEFLNQPIINPTTDTNTGNNEYVAGWKDGFNQGVEFMAKPTENKASTNTGNEYELDNGMGTSTKYSAKEEELKDWEWERMSFTDWKIVDIMDDNGNVISNPSADVIRLCLDNGGERIHSVRRESDGEIFRIGDKVSWGCTGVYETTITGFVIKDGRLKFDDEKRRKHLQPCDFLNAINLRKLPTPTEQTKSDVLFTTEDGVGIKVGDTYFVNDGWYRVCQKLAKKDSKYPPYIADKAFSTKALADQYIIENKPCLSLNDLLEVWSDKGNSSDNPNYYKAAPLYKKFEEKAKQKLNKQ